MKQESKLVLLILTAGCVLALGTVLQEATFSGAVVVESTENDSPIWNGPDEFRVQQELTLKLDRFFSDPDGDSLTFDAGAASGFAVTVEGNTLSIKRTQGGEHIIAVIASDGTHLVRHALRIR